jgi:hypothetical protein
MKENLEIGDKLVNIENNRWTSFTKYTFASVERLTKTQAILSNGVRLKSEKSMWDGVVMFKVVGSYGSYQFATPEIRIIAEKERKNIIAHNWISSKKFSNEEKLLVYEYFKSLNKL